MIDWRRFSCQINHCRWWIGRKRRYLRRVTQNSCEFYLKVKIVQRRWQIKISNRIRLQLKWRLLSNNFSISLTKVIPLISIEITKPLSVCFKRNFVWWNLMNNLQCKSRNNIANTETIFCKELFIKECCTTQKVKDQHAIVPVLCFQLFNVQSVGMSGN